MGKNESPFTKHLAFENANRACQEAIYMLPEKKKGSLSDYVKLCSCFGSSHAFDLAIGAALHHAGIGRHSAQSMF